MDFPSQNWLTQARAGSQEALGHALEACRRYLLEIARQELDPTLRSKGGASDVVQEAFLDAQRDFGQFSGTSDGELRAWLRQLLLHHVYKVARRYRGTLKRSAGREVSLETTAALAADVPAPTATPSMHAMAHEQAEKVRLAMLRLPDDYRQVILWRYQEHLGFEEIAIRLDRSVPAVRKLWARALERLQQEMKGSP